MFRRRLCPRRSAPCLFSKRTGMWDATKCERVPSPMRCGTRSHGRAAQDLVDAVGRHILPGITRRLSSGTLRFSSSCMARADDQALSAAALLARWKRRCCDGTSRPVSGSQSMSSTPSTAAADGAFRNRVSRYVRIEYPRGCLREQGPDNGVSGVRTEPAHIAPEECGDAISAFHTGADEQSIGSELLGRCTPNRTLRRSKSDLTERRGGSDAFCCSVRRRRRSG